MIRSHLSREKRTALFYKLVDACLHRNFKKAHKLAGRGAEINAHFWQRDGLPISFDEFKSNLPERQFSYIPSNFDFHTTYYTPILFAATHQQKELARFLKELGADTTVKKENLQFKRTHEAHFFVGNIKVQPSTLFPYPSAKYGKAESTVFYKPKEQLTYYPSEQLNEELEFIRI